jgi:hypothetical protein
VMAKPVARLLFYPPPLRAFRPRDRRPLSAI